MKIVRKKKMTYIDAINMAIEGNLTNEVIEKLKALKIALEKRACLL